MGRGHVYCIRHGESAANAGEATDDPLLIRLTERGRRQAERVAREWSGPRPSLVVVSPASRARDTAEPTIAQFPGVPVQIWPVHEFTYLAPERCAGTTVDDRREWVKAYWLNADPHHEDGEGAESFATFISRATNAKKSLEQLAASNGAAVVLFGHGQFINALRWLKTAASPLDMAAFRAFDAANGIINCQIVDLS